MAVDNDYLTNLEIVERFPWSLYHRPIRYHVLQVVQQEEQARGSLRILNVGCGLSQIRRHLNPRHECLGVDVDARAIDLCRQRFSGRFEVCQPYELPAESEEFDLVFATEVIEHVPDTQRWLGELLRVLRPGGRLQLSTPNYGDLTLPLIESTFLEWVARRQGFTRKGLHPVPFSSRTLRATLEEAQLKEVEVSKTFLWLALVASARK